MIDAKVIAARLPVWLWAVAAFGAAWNVFGLVQLTDFVAQTRASLIMTGMSPPAAALYYALPTWMKLAFAVGSIGGLIGSLALAVGSRSAIAIFAVSLVGYMALFVGDYAHGVFGAVPGQLAVLSSVVAIAVGLLVASHVARRLGFLR